MCERITPGWAWWRVPIILATQESEAEKHQVQGQLGQLSNSNLKRLMIELNGRAPLGRIPNTAKPINKNKKIIPGNWFKMNLGVRNHQRAPTMQCCYLQHLPICPQPVGALSSWKTKGLFPIWLIFYTLKCQDFKRTRLEIPRSGFESQSGHLGKGLDLSDLCFLICHRGKRPCPG